MGKMIDSETVAVIKDNWEFVKSFLDYEVCVGEQLLTNYVYYQPSVLDNVPFYDTASSFTDDAFDDEALRQSGKYVIKCINEVVEMLDRQHHPKFRPLIRSFGSRLARYNIVPSNYDMALHALLMTLQDVMQDAFTNDIMHHWISACLAIGNIMKDRVGQR